MKYFLIAGEASGDLHGGGLIKALRETDSDARFCFLGGDFMENASGVKPVVHYKRMAYMAFSEVLRHLPDILGNMRAARKALDDFAPDAVILIDYPSFWKRIAGLLLYISESVGMERMACERYKEICAESVFHTAV